MRLRSKIYATRGDILATKGQRSDKIASRRSSFSGRTKRGAERRKQKRGKDARIALKIQSCSLFVFHAVAFFYAYAYNNVTHYVITFRERLLPFQSAFNPLFCYSPECTSNVHVHLHNTLWRYRLPRFLIFHMPQGLTLGKYNTDNLLRACISSTCIALWDL